MPHLCKSRRAACALLVTALLLPASAGAFCGFYVSGAGADMFNNASQVTLMRVGKTTAISLQNDYQGPAEDFALVVPVPVVLQEDNVKILPADVFDRIDRLAAPRLVEYWERDPCFVPEPELDYASEGGAVYSARDSEDDGGVTVEARFTVGEYEIVVLGAEDSGGLDTWLKTNGYKIPDGAEPHLRPYVEMGMKFFVARVDVKKVRFEDGRAMLSPLRMHFDYDMFMLPIQLGLINSAGTQDVIVHILAPGQRYEVKGRPNVTIPTNLDVADEVRERFGEFYAALFDKTLAGNPGAVITEYAWDASWCDPCPIPALDQQELLTLGADVMPGGASQSFVLTRLHTRYAKDHAGGDLMFMPAPPIVGGRERHSGDGLEQGSTPGSTNTFQARYAIRHAWQGEIKCKDPTRGVWGGPWSTAKITGGTGPVAATDLALAPRGQVQLSSMVVGGLPDLPAAGQAPEPEEEDDPGGICAVGASPPGGVVTLLSCLLLLGVVERHRRPAHPG